MQRLAADWRTVDLDEADVALCTFAEKLTHHPKTMRETDVDALRRVGFEDTAIHDATQVISYFNYINRVADALGVQVEDWIHPWERPEQ